MNMDMGINIIEMDEERDCCNTEIYPGVYAVTNAISIFDYFE